MPMPARRRAEIARDWREIGDGAEHASRPILMGIHLRCLSRVFISARAEVDGVPRVEHGHAGHVPPAEHPPVLLW